MAYQSIHSGPAHDAAVTALTEIESARDTVVATGAQVAADASTAVAAASTATTQAGVATDASQSASNSEVAAGLSAAAAADSATDAAEARDVTEEARNTALLYKDESEERAQASAASATQSAASAALALQAAFDAPAVIAARDEAVAARDVTTSARDTTLVHRNAAEAAAANATAVAYSGDASLTPTPGQIPVARATGKIDRGWLDQGLDAITAEALHRSPNAVTAMCIYDTRLDSDGGAWTERCAHTSWWNEPLAGRWLGAQASEAAARAVPGAATGDYFQSITNGRFYRLEAASILEITRGGKRAFPRIAAIVFEAGRGAIYDLTEPGAPMWIVFVASSAANWWGSSPSVGAVAVLCGVLAVSHSGGGGLRRIDFINDAMWINTSSGRRRIYDNVASRNRPGQTWQLSSDAAQGLPSSTVNAIDMAVLPGAPVDPAIGLSVPTIALATAAGVSLIKHDGSVVSSSQSGQFSHVSIDHRTIFAQRSDSFAVYYAQNPASLGQSFALTAKSNTTGPDFNAVATMVAHAARGKTIARGEGSLLRTVRLGLPAFGSAPAAKVSPTYNAGYLTGDIRRAYLASVEDGSVGPAVELIPQPLDFTDGWEDTTFVSSFDSVTFEASGAAGMYFNAGLVFGKEYYVEVVVTRLSGSASFGVRNGIGGSAPQVTNTVTGGPNQIARGFFIATEEQIYLRSSGTSLWEVHAITLREAIPDRSYKTAVADIEGALAATHVATDADLVGYSGWSDTDYLREPYSSDLDFGTGPWSVGAWVKTPESLPEAVISGPELVSNGENFVLDNDGLPEDWDIVLGAESSSFSVANGELQVVRESGAIHIEQEISTVPGAVYRVRLTGRRISGGASVQFSFRVGGSGIATVSISSTSEVTEDIYIVAPGESATVRIVVANNTGTVGVKLASVIQVTPLSIVSRSHESGAGINLGVLPSGSFVATADDGTTTRTVTSTAAYNFDQWINVRAD